VEENVIFQNTEVHINAMVRNKLYKILVKFLTKILNKNVFIFEIN